MPHPPHNYFTPIDDGASATSDSVNNPISQVDAQVKANTDAITANTSNIASNTTAIGGETLATPPDGSATTGLSLRGIANKFSASIGLLSALTTSVKTSAVAAINSIQAQVNGALNSDGTLKNNSVASPQVTDGSIANADLATDAKVGSLASLLTTAKDSLVNAVNEVLASLNLVKLRSASLIPNPLQFKLPAPSLNDYGDGRQVYTIPSTGLSVVTGDVNNPYYYYGGNTLVLLAASDNQGWFIPRELINAPDGATIYFPAEVRCTGMNQVQLRATGKSAVNQTTSTGVMGGAATGGAYSLTALDGQVQVIVTSAFVIPANCAGVELTLKRQNGVGVTNTDVYMYSHWANEGAAQLTAPRYGYLGDIAAEVRGAHTGTQPNINKRFTDLETAVAGAIADPVANGVYGVKFLRDWGAGVARIRTIAAGDNPVASVLGAMIPIDLTTPVSRSQLNGLVLGDSYVENGDQVKVARRILQDELGDAGYGYIGFATQLNNDNITLTPSAGWSTQGAGAAAQGVDNTHLYTTDVSTQRTLQLSGTEVAFQKAEIHYGKQTNGDGFQYSIDGGTTWSATISTAGSGHGVATTPSVDLGQHDINIRSVAGGGAGLIMKGVNLMVNQPGVRLHRAGRSGTDTNDWLAMDAVTLEAAIAALNPNVIIWELGTNDQNNNRTPLAYGNNLAALVDRTRAATPLADIIIIAPPLNGTPGKTPMDQYRDAAKSVAVAKQTGFLDLVEIFGPFAANDPTTGTPSQRFTMNNLNHPNTVGHTLIGWVLIKRMLLQV